MSNSLGQERQRQERERQLSGRGRCPPWQPPHAAPAPGRRRGAPSYRPAAGIRAASAVGSELTHSVNLALET